MKKHTIVLRLGTEDVSPIAPATGHVMSEVSFLNPDVSAKEKITHDLIFEEIRKNGLKPSNLGWDMLLLALAVFCADTRISRNSESQDTWSREIEINVPVSNPKLWQAQSDLLSATLRFLTGDFWTFSFRERPQGFTEIEVKPKQGVPDFNPTLVSLFSGGLDSFVGAIDLLSAGEIPLLVGHRKSNDVGVPQKKAYDYLTKKFDQTLPHFASFMIRSPKSLLNGEDEKTERGRSFLFLALAVLCASGSKEAKLIVPENGLISLNVPLTTARLGALSTRTTHPYYLQNYQILLNNLQIPVRIENPYQFKTKGEMLRECADKKILLGHLVETFSCASPAQSHWIKGAPSSRQCGYCVPCLIRRAAIESAFGKDETDYTLDLHNSPEFSGTQGGQIHAFKIACGRLKKNRLLARFLVHKSGPLPSDTSFTSKASEVYLRGMEEVANLVSDIELRK